MYVTTFYSFKGGVGRTMALVNVATQLAQMGRRVLIVDFDLEAPGLDTLAIPRSTKPTPGIVDFVSEYLTTGQAPDAADFIYEADWVGRQGGRLFVMPAGRNDELYHDRFSHIDWAALYEHHDGFILFEDLKEQWRQLVAPDYVLIDSRTGHTDVGGICTRHLPDSVVILFFPNEQNLRGLTKVVRDIRSEATPPRNKKIELHFVMSNIPDLDDEDLILANRLKDFRAALSIDEPLTIHRYDSLSLLNQTIFTRERPRSRLAREYVELTDRVVGANTEDREGALRFLRSAQRLRTRKGPGAVDQQITDIISKHSRDGEVLHAAATIRMREGRVEEAISLLNESIESGYASPDAFLQRADSLRILGKPEDASLDALKVLEASEADSYQLEHAVRILRATRPSLLPQVLPPLVTRAAKIRNPGSFAARLNWSTDELAIGREILSMVLTDSRVSPNERESARSQLAMALIGLGEFEQAAELLDSVAGGPADIADMFNHAMAVWGSTGEVPKTLFERVRELDLRDADTNGAPNYLQCLALASWATGNIGEAETLSHRARQAIVRRPNPEFSCWRYLTVPATEFVSDLDSFGHLVKHGRPLPTVMGSRGYRPLVGR